MLSSSHGRRFCVLQNEFGSVPVDDALMTPTGKHNAHMIHCLINIFGDNIRYDLGLGLILTLNRRGPSIMSCEISYGFARHVLLG